MLRRSQPKLLLSSNKFIKSTVVGLAASSSVLSSSTSSFLTTKYSSFTLANYFQNIHRELTTAPSAAALKKLISEQVLMKNKDNKDDKDNNNKKGNNDDKKDDKKNDDDDDDGNSEDKKSEDLVNKFLRNVTYGVGAVTLLALFAWNMAYPGGKHLSWKELYALADEIENIIVYDEYAQVTLSDDYAFVGVRPSMTSQTDDEIRQLLSQRSKDSDRVSVSFAGIPIGERFLNFIEVWSFVAPFLFFPLFTLVVSRAAASIVYDNAKFTSQISGRREQLLTQAGEQFQIAKKTTTRFRDIAGMTEAKSEIVEIVDFLKHPDKYTRLGAKIPAGGLLIGVPGTGKTMLARAVAGESDTPFIACTGSDFVELYAGMGALRVRKLFELARKEEKCIIYIDEIDAIGGKRSGGGMGEQSEQEHTLNELLTQLDGFNKEKDRIIILASTNADKDQLDSALTRPGRFDRIINVEAPVLKERVELFETYLKTIKLMEQKTEDSSSSVENAVDNKPVELDSVDGDQFKLTNTNNSDEKTEEGKKSDQEKKKEDSSSSKDKSVVEEKTAETTTTSTTKSDETEKSSTISSITKDNKESSKDDSSSTKKFSSPAEGGDQQQQQKGESKPRESPSTPTPGGGGGVVPGEVAAATLTAADSIAPTTTGGDNNNNNNEKKDNETTDEEDDKSRDKKFPCKPTPEFLEIVKNYAERMSNLCPGFVGADISSVCNEAAILAAREKSGIVELDHLERSVDRVLAGIEHRSRVLSDFEKKVVAHHEAGHAVAGWFLGRADPLMKVSIVPRGGKALGYAQYLPNENQLRTSAEIEDSICVTLGGRVAEKIFFDHLSTGASDDLQKIRRMAYAHASTFNRATAVVSPGSSQTRYAKPYGESTEESIDAAAKQLVDRMYQRTYDLLLKHKDLMEKLAEHLMKHEVITHTDILNYMGPRMTRPSDNAKVF